MSTIKNRILYKKKRKRKLLKFSLLWLLTIFNTIWDDFWFFFQCIKAVKTLLAMSLNVHQTVISKAVVSCYCFCTIISDWNLFAMMTNSHKFQIISEIQTNVYISIYWQLYINTNPMDATPQFNRKYSIAHQ